VFNRVVRSTWAHNCSQESLKQSLKAITDVIRKAAGSNWDGTCLAVSTPQSITPFLQKTFEEWDQMCGQMRFEYVDSEAKGRNEYGEPVGMERMKEALEATDWTAEEGYDIDGEDFEELMELEAGGEGGGMDKELAEMDEELKGMKSSLLEQEDEDQDEDEEEQVEEMEKMMSKLRAIKGLSVPWLDGN
jgi:predicted  nucleic acid-binding Zn-ribbon protein